MLPGRRYTPDTVLAILKKRVWMILVPLAIAAAGTVVWSASLPDLYRSRTTIQIVPQRISETLVRSTIQVKIEDRLQSIRDAILSRPRLEALIEEFDLYPEDRSTVAMQDLVGQMRDDTRISILRDDAFEVSFRSPDPVKAMRVAERLGGLVIDESLSYRHNLTEDTDRFLESQLIETRRELEAQERRLENYRRTYAGELPTQAATNIQQLTSANARMQQAVDNANQLRQRRLLVERQMLELERLTPEEVPDALASGRDASGELANARAAVEALAARGLKSGHPDMDAAQRRLRDAQQRADREAAAAVPVAGAQVPPAEARRQARLAELTAEMTELDRQIAGAEQTARQFSEAAQAIEAKLDAIPTRETEMIALTRDYEIIAETYRNLLRKQEDARISANLERRQVGEQFNIIEPARVPERPSSPDRQRLNLMGALAGLAFGLALVGLLEFRDRSFRTDDDVSAVLGLPVLAIVPVMKSEVDRRREMARAVATHVGCGALVTACAAVCVYVLVAS